MLGNSGPATGIGDGGVRGVGVFRRVEILVHNGTQVQTAGQEGTAGKTAAPHVLFVNEGAIASEDLLGIDVLSMVPQEEERTHYKISITARTGNLICRAGIYRIIARFGDICRENEANEEWGKIDPLDLEVVALAGPGAPSDPIGG